MKGISVVIPTFNRVAFVGEAIESVLTQSHPAGEVIVVDDGSTDGTDRLLRRFGGRIRVLRQENRGVSAARNRGIRAAQYDWIALLDSDDWWTPHKLAEQVGFVERHPDTLALQSQDQWIRHGRRVNPRQVHQKRGGWIFRFCLPRCIVSSSDILIHRRLLFEEGLFDESFPACEDYDLYMRIASRYRIELVDHVGTVKRGGHADQLSRRIPALDRYRVRALQRILDRPLADDDRRAVLEVLARKLAILIKGGTRRQHWAEVGEWQDQLDRAMDELRRWQPPEGPARPGQAEATQHEYALGPYSRTSR